jgi:hypothetical protein
MEEIKLISPKKISLKDHPSLSETWLQGILAKSPEMLGLGDLELKDKERKHPKAGRLDLLFQDPEKKRYEVEIQLGKLDESHIIRTIEYWDIERKRYPQYEHCAVIVAEEITSRFLNVISLFNGHIPLIAIQLTAYEVAGEYMLTFNTVLGQMRLGLVDEDEEVGQITDRNFWENKNGTPKTLKMTDDALKIITEVIPGYQLNYTKFYIGMVQHGRPDNFIIFRPQKNNLRMEIKLQASDSLSQKIDESGIDLLDYDTRETRYRLKLNAEDLRKHREFLKELIRLAKGLSQEAGDDLSLSGTT